jgi:hypothetical protein
VNTAIISVLCFLAGLLIGWRANQQHLYGRTVNALAAMMRADAAKKAARDSLGRRGNRHE